MIVLLSPAKDLSLEPADIKGTTQPALLDLALPVAEKMRTMSARKLSDLMDISPKLAQLNQERYRNWQPPFTTKNALPAAFMFNGEAYRGLKARTLSADDLRFGQHHLRILSGLYGLLRPLDLIQPYRLEMGIKLPMGRGKKDLYAWWKEAITQEMAAALKKSGSNVIINLASAEYFKAVDTDALGAQVITPVFKDQVGSNYRMVTVFAKHQRGAMTRHILQHRILEPLQLKEYDGDGYRFAPAESTDTEWTFLRDRKSR